VTGSMWASLRTTRPNDFVKIVVSQPASYQHEMSHGQIAENTCVLRADKPGPVASCSTVSHGNPCRTHLMTSSISVTDKRQMILTERGDIILTFYHRLYGSA